MPAVRAAGGPALLLIGTGALFLIVAVAGVVVGLAFGERIHAMLPPITADADAIGGAALALGAASGLTGLVHIGFAVLLRPEPEGILVPAIAFCAVMAVLALAWAVAAFVSAAAGTAPAVPMLVAGAGLGLLAAGYAWASAVLLRLRRTRRGTQRGTPRGTPGRPI